MKARERIRRSRAACARSRQRCATRRSCSTAIRRARAATRRPRRHCRDAFRAPIANGMEQLALGAERVAARSGRHRATRVRRRAVARATADRRRSQIARASGRSGGGSVDQRPHSASAGMIVELVTVTATNNTQARDIRQQTTSRRSPLTAICSRSSRAQRTTARSD